MPLLQSLADAAPPEPDEYVLLADDDLTFARQGPSAFLRFVAAAGLDIAQPAHVLGSHGTYENLEVRAATTARQVGYVEVGPLVAVSPRAQRLVLPFPAEAQMGWGLDVVWSGLARTQGLRLGVVDATPMVHHGKVGAAYDSEVERRLLDQNLAELQVASPHELSVTLPPRWRPWQRRAPWIVDAGDAMSG
ncbi:hypothetical protein [Humibacillus xanthopallidus]|nr:hypothetical protein [Humibacillus xanthopallidus]